MVLEVIVILLVHLGTFIFRNQKRIPFDAKISVGEYLAGDKGVTFEISRTYINGTSFGAFATFTDVSTEEYGEGSFDKGIYFATFLLAEVLVVIHGDLLTKDPGSKLNRKYTLYDLLVKFRPYNQ